MNSITKSLSTLIVTALLLSGCGSTGVRDGYTEQIITNTSSTSDSSGDEVQDLTLADNKGITEYRWYAGASNPLFKYSSEYLTSVRPESITINRSRGRSSYDTIYNVELNSELFLPTSIINVTGIYPTENYITFTMKKVKTDVISDIFNTIN